MGQPHRIIRRKTPEAARDALCLAALQRAALLLGPVKPDEATLAEAQAKLDRRAIAYYNITNGELEKTSNVLVDEDGEDG